MISFIFCVFILGCVTDTNSIYNYSLYSDSIRGIYHGISDFTVDTLNFSGKSTILTFGGQYGQNKSNQMIQSIPYTNSSSISITNVKPAGRSKHCTLTNQYKLYIYGGVSDTGQLLRDLWQFNTIFQTWTHISDSSVDLINCNIIMNNTEIIIAGLTYGLELKMVRFSFFSYTWVNLSYFYADYIQLSGNLWYEKNQSVLLSVDDLSPQDGTNIDTTNLLFNQKFITSQLFILPFRPNIYTSPTSAIKPSNYTYLMVTQSKILLFNTLNQQIRWIRNLIGQSSTAKDIQDCQISQNWVLIFKINIVNKQIVMEYYSLNNFEDSGSNFYNLPQLFEGNPEGNLKTAVVNGNIFIASEHSLNSWILYEHCDMDSNITHVQTCSYDQIHCQDGFRGPYCNETVCPNTLYLYDRTKNDQIFFQCSNHGKCTQSGCVCDKYWTGQDCSIYTRKECKGELLYNWPIMNCQCQEQTSGGNSCEVVFCYNDCSQHGTCLTSGLCQCEAGYYGQDCSITIIQFPGLLITI